MNPFPDCFRIRQHFAADHIEDCAAAVVAQLERSGLQQMVRPGHSVAIAVGSRGIARLDEIVAATVGYCRTLAAEPFIVPAMGSHGGATAEGQTAVLHRLGVTPERVGCAIRATMETDVLGEAAAGLPIYFDRYARAADHIVLINRVKPHTRFSGDVESGLLKMMMIGLGKHRGAAQYHRAFQQMGFAEVLQLAIPRIRQQCPVRMGLAVVENAYDQPARIEAIASDAFFSREAQLLQIARQNMARLPFDEADLLILDEIGKEISGSGMDTNVVGRKHNDRVAAEDEYPKIRHLYVRGLSAATGGNATGIGMADFCRTRVVERMDVEATRVNCLTAGHIAAAMIPVHWETDRQCLEAAASQAGLTPPAEARWMWIRNTLHLSEMLCSAAYWPLAQQRDDLEVLSEPAPLALDAAGQLVEQIGHCP